MWKFTISLAVLLCASMTMAQKVLVQPMERIGGDASQGFVSQALVQGISTDLNRTGPWKAISSTKEGQADYLVTGSYQINQGELRITGQVLNVSSKTAVGSIKATGPLRDLFTLEDEVGRQVVRALASTLSANPATQPARELPVVQPSGPVRVDLPPSNSFEGSQLQQALATGRDPVIGRSNYDRYYNTPPAPYYSYPYGYGSGWGYPYYGSVYGAGYYSLGGYFGTYPVTVYVDHSHVHDHGHDNHGDHHSDGHGGDRRDQ